MRCLFQGTGNAPAVLVYIDGKYPEQAMCFVSNEARYTFPSLFKKYLEVLGYYLRIWGMFYNYLKPLLFCKVYFLI